MTTSEEPPAYYTLQRQPRMLSARQRAQGARSSYVGSEVFVSLVDTREAPYPATLRQLGVDVLATNRDLPLLMPLAVPLLMALVERQRAVEPGLERFGLR